MYKRELLTQLHQWSIREPRKPLVIRGARQVGKSTLVREFGKEFDIYVEVNLEISDDANIFLLNDDVTDIWRYLCLRNHIVSNQDKRILLFIDEIQEVPKAVSLLRYFYEKLPWLYVITAGSRLQSLFVRSAHNSQSRKERVSFPVSRVEYLNLRPFSFIEFIRAVEGEEWVDLIKKRTISPYIHNQLLHHFNLYALIGGMPEAVAKYAITHDIVSLSPIFNSLLKGYSEDVEYYARNDEQVRIIRHILSTLWASAAESITFARFGNSSYSSLQIHEAMDLLEKAYIISLDYPVSSTEAPAIPNKRRSPKLITIDSGLTNFFAGIQMEYLQNKDLLDTWRGRAAEQIVAQELRIVLDKNYRDYQYYWIRDKEGAKAEVDFVWQYNSHIIPIEVKSGTNSHLRSLHSFVNHCEQPVTAIRVWNGEFSIQDIQTPAPHEKSYRLINVPFYYIGLLDEIVRDYIVD
ncbi:MAG: ATP-binding protein [Bacteroidaceae bacterium]|nr:ATP-binding protein [Bacteroidaceae bacterium]